MPQDISALVQALVEGNEQERRAAVEQLIAMGPEAAEAIPALTQALSNQDQAVRQIVAEVLGIVGPQATTQAIPALIQALGDSSESVRLTAAEALSTITGQNFGLDAALWQQWWAEQQAALQADSGGGPLDFPAPTQLDAWEEIEGGYQATIVVHIVGGVAPFVIRHDMDTFVSALRDFPLVFTASGCTIIHVIAVESADEQSVSHDYYITSPWCG